MSVSADNLQNKPVQTEGQAVADTVAAPTQQAVPLNAPVAAPSETAITQTPASVLTTAAQDTVDTSNTFDEPLDETSDEMNLAMALSMGLINPSENGSFKAKSPKIAKTVSEPKPLTPPGDPIPTAATSAPKGQPKVAPKIDPKIEKKSSQDIDPAILKPLAILKTVPQNLLGYWFTIDGLSELKAIIEFIPIKAEEPDVLKSASFLKNVFDDKELFERLLKAVVSAHAHRLTASQFKHDPSYDVTLLAKMTEKVQWWFRQYTKYIKQKESELAASLGAETDGAINHTAGKKDSSQPGSQFSNGKAAKVLGNENGAPNAPGKVNPLAGKKLPVSGNSARIRLNDEEEDIRKAMELSMKDLKGQTSGAASSNGPGNPLIEKKVIKEEAKQKEIKQKNEAPKNEAPKSADNSRVNTISPVVSNAAVTNVQGVSPSTTATTSAPVVSQVILPPTPPRPPIAEQIAIQRAALDQLQNSILDDERKLELESQTFLQLKVNQEENWEKRILSFDYERNAKARAVTELEELAPSSFRRSEKIEEAKRVHEKATQVYVQAVANQETCLKEHARIEKRLEMKRRSIEESKLKIREISAKLDALATLERSAQSGARVQIDAKIQRDRVAAPPSDVTTQGNRVTATPSDIRTQGNKVAANLSDVKSRSDTPAMDSKTAADNLAPTRQSGVTQPVSQTQPQPESQPLSVLATPIYGGGIQVYGATGIDVLNDPSIYRYSVLTPTNNPAAPIPQPLIAATQEIAAPQGNDRNPEIVANSGPRQETSTPVRVPIDWLRQLREAEQNRRLQADRTQAEQSQTAGLLLPTAAPLSSPLAGAQVSSQATVQSTLSTADPKKDKDADKRAAL